jgi:hypothetical protein
VVNEIKAKYYILEQGLARFKAKIPIQNRIILPEGKEREPSILNCPPLSLLNSLGAKYCSFDPSAIHNLL